MTAPEVCPVCGTPVPPGSTACPDCGADENAGWDAGRAADDGLDLPGGDFDYQVFLRREFGHGRPAGRRRWLAVGAVILLLVLLALLLR